MNKKDERRRKIKNFLRFQTGPVTVSEIHEALSNRMGLDVSRKTIERDVLDMELSGVLLIHPGTPARFELMGPSEIEISLKVGELRELIHLLDPNSDLALKLNGFMAP
jgi:hypothetical protein